MKKMVTILSLISMSLLAFSFTAAAACPDFSGAYNGTYPSDDFRNQETITIKQTSCDSISGTSVMTFKKGDSRTDNFEWTIGQSVDNKTWWFWNADQLMSLQKDANSDHCDIRDIAYIDSNKNLVFRFRFECPKSGNSQWYWGSNANDGTYYRK